MADLFLLSRVQMRRIERYFPLSHGIARVDDRRIVSAIVFVIKNGLRLARRSARLWPAQDNLQSVCLLEPPRRVQQDFRRTGGQGRQTGADHDRRHASKGAPHGCKPFKKGLFPDARAPKAARTPSCTRFATAVGARLSGVVA